MPVSEIDSLKQDVLRTHLADLSKDGRDAVTDFVQRGYLTEDGQSTELGDEFLSLLDSGLMDDRGNLTDEGKIYAMSYRDSLDADPAIYQKRDERGLNQLDKDSGGDGGGFWSMLGDVATKGFPRIAETAYNAYAAPAIEAATIVPRSIYKAVAGDDIKLPRTQTHDETVNAIAENITGGLLASEPLAAGAAFGAEQLAATLQGKKDEAYAAKQAWERHNAEVTELKGAEMMDFLTGADQWLKSREALVAQHGEEAVKIKEEQDRLAGNFAFDPSNILSVGAGKLVTAGAGAMARGSLYAEKMALKGKVLAAGTAAAAAERATLEAAVAKASTTVSKAAERAAALRSVGNDALATRWEGVAQRLSDRTSPYASRITELTETEAKLASELESLGSKPAVAEAIVAANQKLAALKQLPPQAVGSLLENVGTGLVKTDEFASEVASRIGIDGVYKSMRSLPGRAGSFVSASMLGPMAAVPAAIGQVLATGPLLQGVGNFTKILGKEFIAERGSVPFWRRVANNSTISKTQRFLAHRMDEMTLGGRATEVLGKAAKGTAAAYPMNLALDVLQDPNHDIGASATRALSPSLVFGGGSAGAGALFKGSKQRMKTMRLADEINFTRNLTPDQRSGFDSLSRGGRRVVSTYAAAFPNLNWEFTPHAPSRYDSSTNTVRVNPESPNPIRALVGHEVEHYLTIRNQMQPVIHSMLLGDAVTPGLLRSTDGKLAPEFQKFSDAYNKRMADQGLDPVPLEKMAEEYFNEATVDHLTEMVESGELSKMAGRTQLGRKVNALIEATIPKSAILRDFFWRTGGVMDSTGRHVMGNGLLADGIRENPAARKMMRDMVRSSAGEAATVQGKGINPKEGAGTAIPVEKGDPIIDSFHPVLETDANGVPIKDKDGNHVALSRATDEARSSAGHIITEAQTKRVNEGYLPDPDEIKMQPDGTWAGTYIPKPLLDALAARGILNNKQIAILRNISTATKGGDGIRYLITNHPATIKGRGGKVRYSTMGATLRETVPVGFQITKDGNILVNLMNVEQLNRNINTRAASKTGKSLYDGNTEVIKQDIAAMMDLHKANKKTDAYYQTGEGGRPGFTGYGPKWQEHQRFINTIFGQMTKEQQNINPMFQSDKVDPRSGVYRTYRLDRISKATKMDGTPMPFGYTHVKMNYFPDGVMDEVPSGQ